MSRCILKPILNISCSCVGSHAAPSHDMLAYTRNKRLGTNYLIGKRPAGSLSMNRYIFSRQCKHRSCIRVGMHYLASPPPRLQHMRARATSLKALLVPTHLHLHSRLVSSPNCQSLGSSYSKLIYRRARLALTLIQPRQISSSPCSRRFLRSGEAMSSKLVPSNPSEVMVIRHVRPDIVTFSVPFLRLGHIKIGGRGTVGAFPARGQMLFTPPPPPSIPTTQADCPLQ